MPLMNRFKVIVGISIRNINAKSLLIPVTNMTLSNKQKKRNTTEKI